MPLYGHELNEDIDPLQAGLAWAVKLDKDDFHGKEALLRRQNDPTLRRRVGIEMKGKRIAREGAILKAVGRPIGAVTSGTPAPTEMPPMPTILRRRYETRIASAPVPKSNATGEKLRAKRATTASAMTPRNAPLIAVRANPIMAWTMIAIITGLMP